MKLLADKNGEQFLNIIEEEGDSVLVQFISSKGDLNGKPFRDSLSDLMVVGWTHRCTSTAIGLNLFKSGGLEDARVSFALHQLYPMGRKVRLPSGEVVLTASYANTHSDGYYMYVRRFNADQLSRIKISPDWVLLPSDKLLALPYYPKVRTQQELDDITEFERWSAGF